MTQSFGQSIRSEFPAYVDNPKLIYFDSAATSLKPMRVIEAMTEALGKNYGTVHRSIYSLAKKSTERYELAREKISSYIHSKTTSQVIFCRGTTDAINLVAYGLDPYIMPGDEIVLTILEHHSNLVPWQMLAKRKGAVLRFIGADEKGILDTKDLLQAFNSKTRLFAASHMPNTTGILQDLTPYIQLAKSYGAFVLLDGAQAMSSCRVDVEKLGCDFYTFSSHKMYGPTGLGILWGTQEALEKLQPRDGGGEMVDTVLFDHSSFTTLPLRLEAGTPPITEVITFKTALDFLASFEQNQLLHHKIALSSQLIDELERIEGVRVFATKGSSSVVMFSIDGIHPYDMTHFLDLSSIAMRSGHMCAQLALKRLKLDTALRASFGVYNDFDELDHFVNILKKTINRLR